MIIEIKIANYRSINEEQTLSFVADRATRHPDNLIKRPGYRLLKAVGLFGANASGKSNFLKAMGAMSTFVRDSATKMNDGDPIEAAEPYRLDPEARSKPSRFEITFLTEGTVYTYGFAVGRQRVHEEWLMAKREGHEKELLFAKRIAAINGEGDTWKWNGLPESDAVLLVRRTRANALFLSTAARENVQELLNVYRFFSTGLWAIDMGHLARTLTIWTAHDCMSNQYFSRQVEDLVRDADTGIETLRQRYEALAEPEYSDAGNGTLVPRAPRLDIVYSQVATDGTSVDFDLFKDASIGTQRLYGLAGLLLKALQAGRFLAIDELDASMHPLLTRKLLELFQSPEANPNGAQLLFTTHDPSLLDQVLFRRDQIWLAEKCNGASTFFSLADIKPPVRNTEAFLGNYLTGRYGGTPHLGPAFDMVETESKA